MKRSNRNLLNNRTQISLSVTYLGSVEEFQDGNKCFKPFLYYPNGGLSPWHEAKNPEVVLTWKPCWTTKTKCHFRLTQHHKIGTQGAWVSNVCGEKGMAKGWSKCCLWLPVGHSERTRDSMHKLSQGNTDWDIQKKLFNWNNNQRVYTAFTLGYRQNLTPSDTKPPV